MWLIGKFGRTKIIIIALDSNESMIDSGIKVLGYDSCFGSSMDLFTGTVVICERDMEQQLAEKMIDLGLKPWKKKWSSYSSSNKPVSEIEKLIEYICETEKMDIMVYYDHKGPKKDLEAVLPLKSLEVHLNERSRSEHEYLLILDGDEHKNTRRVATPFINNSDFYDLGIKKIDGFSKADRCYPEIIVSDHVSGYVTSLVNKDQEGKAWSILEDNIERAHKINKYNFSSNHADSSLKTTKYKKFDELVGVLAWDKGEGLEKSDKDRNHERMVQNSIDSKVIKDFLFQNK